MPFGGTGLNCLFLLPETLPGQLKQTGSLKCPKIAFKQLCWSQILLAMTLDYFHWMFCQYHLQMISPERKRNSSESLFALSLSPMYHRPSAIHNRDNSNKIQYSQMLNLGKKGEKRWGGKPGKGLQQPFPTLGPHIFLDYNFHQP